MKDNVCSKGFTLIELLLVVAILGILSVISFSSFMGTIARGRDTQRKSDLAQIKKALESFNNDFGVYPDSQTGSILGCMNSSSGAFVKCPASNGGFRYYVRSQEVNNLLKFPSDPDASRVYYYTFDSSTSTFALYAALENLNDKDVKNVATSPSGADWGVDCGSVNCNYKITNAGLEQ